MEDGISPNSGVSSHESSEATWNGDGKPRADGNGAKREIRQYYDLDFGGRERVRDTLSKTATKKIQDEEGRINRIRERFQRDPQKADLLKHLRDSFITWRREAAVKPGTKIQAREPAARYTESHVDKEEKDMSFDEPLEGFKAGVMHFEKCEGGWEGVDYRHPNPAYNTRGFPDQKISVDDLINNPDHNAFTHKGDRLKYFHFPANHMHWVEVRPVAKRASPLIGCLC